MAREDAVRQKEQMTAEDMRQQNWAVLWLCIGHCMATEQRLQRQRKRWAHGTWGLYLW